MMSKEIMDRMKALRKDLDNEPRIITVSKIGKDEDDLKIFVWPVTTRDYQKILKETDRIDAAVLSIVLRAKNEDGKQLFSINERSELINLFGPKIILKLASEINKDLNDLNDESGIEIMGN